MKDMYQIVSDIVPRTISKFQLNEKAERWLMLNDLFEFTQH